MNTILLLIEANAPDPQSAITRGLKSFWDTLTALDLFVIVAGLLGMILWLIAVGVRRRHEKKSKLIVAQSIVELVKGQAAKQEDIDGSADKIATVLTGGEYRTYLVLRDVGLGLMIAGVSAFFVDRNIADHGNQVFKDILAAGEDIKKTGGDVKTAAAEISRLSNDIRQNSVLREVAERSSPNLWKEVQVQILQPAVQYLQIEETCTLREPKSGAADLVDCDLHGTYSLINKRETSLNWPLDLYMSEKKPGCVAKFRSIKVFEGCCENDPVRSRAEGICLKAWSREQLVSLCDDKSDPNAVHFHYDGIVLKPARDGYVYRVEFEEDFTEPIDGGSYFRQTKYACSDGIKVELNCFDDRIAVDGGYLYPVNLLPDNQRPQPLDKMTSYYKLEISGGLLPSQGVYFEWSKRPPR